MKWFAAALLALPVFAVAQVAVRKTGAGEFDSLSVFSAPKLSTEQGENKTNVTLTASKSVKTAEVTYSVFLEAVYRSSTPRRYTSVSLVGGDSISVVRLSTDAFFCNYNCLYAEVGAVPLSADLVALGAQHGMRMRWNAERLGTFETEIPATHFAALLQEVGPPVLAAKPAEPLGPKIGGAARNAPPSRTTAAPAAPKAAPTLPESTVIRSLN